MSRWEWSLQQSNWKDDDQEEVKEGEHLLSCRLIWQLELSFQSQSLSQFFWSPKRSTTVSRHQLKLQCQFKLIHRDISILVVVKLKTPSQFSHLFFSPKKKWCRLCLLVVSFTLIACPRASPFCVILLISRPTVRVNKLTGSRTSRRRRNATSLHKIASLFTLDLQLHVTHFAMQFPWFLFRESWWNAWCPIPIVSQSNSVNITVIASFLLVHHFRCKKREFAIPRLLISLFMPSCLLSSDVLITVFTWKCLQTQQWQDKVKKHHADVRGKRKSGWKC